MTRTRFYPCQTEDGRTYVMRSNWPTEPTIHYEILGEPDTTRRWREAQRRAESANRNRAERRAEAKARFWIIALAIVALIGIVAAFKWGV